MTPLIITLHAQVEDLGGNQLSLLPKDDLQCWQRMEEETVNAIGLTAGQAYKRQNAVTANVILRSGVQEKTAKCIARQLEQ